MPSGRDRDHAQVRCTVDGGGTHRGLVRDHYFGLRYSRGDFVGAGRGKFHELMGEGELPESDLLGQRAPVQKHDVGRASAVLHVHVAYLSAVIAMALSTCPPRVAMGGR